MWLLKESEIKGLMFCCGGCGRFVLFLGLPNCYNWSCCQAAI